MEKLQMKLDLQEAQDQCTKLIRAIHEERRLFAVVLAITVIAIALLASHSMAKPVQSDLKEISQIVTEKMQVFNHEPWIGCPHATYRVQGTFYSVAPDPIWSETIENIRALDKSSFRRGHITINWHPKPDKLLAVK